MPKNTNGVSHVETDNAKSEAQEFKRAQGLVHAAIKASKEGFPAIRRGFAAAMFHFVNTGRATLMNELYMGMEKKDSYAMTAFAIRGVIDKYAGDGVRSSEDESKWAIRPTPFLEFKSNPSKETPGEHFRMVNVKDNEKLSKAQIKAIKATKRNIIAAGEEALSDASFWDKPSAFSALEAEYTIADFNKALVALLRKAAKAGASLPFSADDYTKIARAAKLDSKSITAIRDSYDDGSKDDDDDDTETVDIAGRNRTVENRETVQ